MCLIVVAWRASAGFPLVVAANRDEWRERPTERAHWWSEHPELLAGRDLRAGGTWMGITREGRFAAVTNFRDPSDRRSTARSRGGLVTEFLLGCESPRRYLAGLAAPEYNGFNLIVGDGTELLYFGSRESEARAIEPGVHGLSNHLLDEPWPKVVEGRTRMEAAIASRDPAPALFEMLSSEEVAPDAHLPATGVGLEWERRLSSALITGEDYGTRASTVLTVSSSGEVSMEERTRDAAGGVAGVVKEVFTLRRRGAVLQAAG